MARRAPAEFRAAIQGLARHQDLIAAHRLCWPLSADHSHPHSPAPNVAIATGPTQSQSVVAIGKLTALLAALPAEHAQYGELAPALRDDARERASRSTPAPQRRRPRPPAARNGRWFA